MPRNYTYVCEKHSYSMRGRFGGLCPTCRAELTCKGDRMRIGKDGNFNKIERKTKKFDGQRDIAKENVLRRRANEAFKKYFDELSKKKELENQTPASLSGR